MRTMIFINWFLAAFVALSFGYLLNVPDRAKHECQWQHCPYKGVREADRKEAVIEYTGCDEGTDGYCIDMLHLENHSMEYDQLDSMLFTTNTK